MTKTADDLRHAYSWDDLATVIDLARNPALPMPPAVPRPQAKAPGKVVPGRPPAGYPIQPGRSGIARAAAGRGNDPHAAPAPPAPRSRRLTPLTPMRQQAAKSMRRLAQGIQQDHPELAVHDHVRDAARTLESGNEEASQRHLRAAMFSLTPQSLHRNGVHDDEGHISARQAVHGVHRHLLLVKDIQDVAAKNQAAIRRDSYGDYESGPSLPHADPNAGYGPGALAQKPTQRQPGGDRALNAPDRTNSGGSDPNVADPVGPQPKGSKQFASWDEVCTVIDLAWVPNPSKAQWAAIDAKSGHSLPDQDAKDDEAKADAHIRNARQASAIGQHQVAMKHLARASALTADPGKQASINQMGGAVVKNAQLQGKASQLVLARSWDELAAVIELSARTAQLEVTPASRGKPGGPGLYDVKGMGHDPYYQQIVKALIEKRGMPPGKAYAIARGAIRRWSRGGGKVHPEVRAAAGAAEAGELAKQARAKAIHGHANTWDGVALELATVSR